MRAIFWKKPFGFIPFHDIKTWFSWYVCFSAPAKKQNKRYLKKNKQTHYAFLNHQLCQHQQENYHHWSPPKIIQACVRTHCPRNMSTSALERDGVGELHFGLGHFSEDPSRKCEACRGMFAPWWLSGWLASQFLILANDQRMEKWWKLLIFSSLSTSQKFSISAFIVHS